MDGEEELEEILDYKALFYLLPIFASVYFLFFLGLFLLTSFVDVYFFLLQN